jgi:hypothetical protein
LRPAKPSPSTAASPASPSAHAHAHAAANRLLRVHHLLNQRLNHGPFIVIGDEQAVFVLGHHLLLHLLLELGGVESPAAKPTGTAAAKTSRPAAAKSSGASGSAAIVILGGQASAAEAQAGGHPANT